MVDAADHKVGLAAVQQLIDGQFDTVHGRTGAGPHLGARIILAPTQIKRVGGGEGTGEARAASIGGTDKHIAQVGDEGNKASDAVAIEAVVVGNEDEGSVLIHHCINL